MGAARRAGRAVDAQPTGGSGSRRAAAPPRFPCRAAAAARRHLLRGVGEAGVNAWQHTDFKFHRRMTQIGCYWGAGGHTELYLLEGDRLALIDTGVADTPGLYV